MNCKKTAALEALFNNESSSDLVLRLSKVDFYVHKAVMMPACSMIEQYVKWPQDHNDNCSGSRSICDIVLPDISIPESIGSVNLSPGEANRLFDLFLRTVYGLVNPSQYQSIQDVILILIIANFMMSNEVKEQCELELINQIKMKSSKWIYGITLCRKYHLPKLLDQTLKHIGTIAHQLTNNEGINLLEVKELLEVLTYFVGDSSVGDSSIGDSSIGDSSIILEVLLNYCSQLNRPTDIHHQGNDDKIIITRQDRLECLIKGYEILSTSWTTWAVIDHIYNRTKLIVVNCSSGQEYSHLKLFRIVLDRMSKIFRNLQNSRGS